VHVCPNDLKGNDRLEDVGEDGRMIDYKGRAGLNCLTAGPMTSYYYNYRCYCTIFIHNRSFRLG
jgi:hypothetical protein